MILKKNIIKKLLTSSKNTKTFELYRKLACIIKEIHFESKFVLSDIDIRTLNNYSQFISSIDTLVSKFGKSLITFGNTYIQNNYDDPTLSVLNNMLPVKFGNNENEDKLVTLCLDISRSMEQAERLIIAKEILCSTCY